MNLLLIELVKVFGEMLFETVQRLLDLCLLLVQDLRVSKVFELELSDRSEHFHVFSELQADQVRQSEERLVVLLAHE